MHPRSIRRHAALVVLVLAAAMGAALVGQSPQSATAADIVSRVKSQFAPDARIAVFTVQAEVKENAIELVGDVEQPAAKEALLKAFKDAGFANVVDRIAVLPDPAMAAKPLGIVTVSVAVMKTKPSHASELGNQLIMGMVVKMLKSESGWYFVQSLDDRYLGWMEPSHLALMTKDQADAFARGPRAIVTSLFAFVRERPSPDGAPVCDLVVGRRVERDRTERGMDWRCSCRTGARGSSRTRTRPTTRPGRRAGGSRRRPSSRPRGASWACRTCGAAPRRRGSTARAISRPCSA